MELKNHFLLLAIVISVVNVNKTLGKQYSYRRSLCGCVCGFNNRHVCDTIEELRSVADANAEQLRIWANYRQFVQHFAERWQEEISDIVETTIKDYISKGELLPKPENLVHKLEDGMLNDSAMVMKPVEEDSNLAKNVTTLLEKVEMVENRTTEVEKELKTERRVRRDLEEKVNKTHFSLVYIEDQLQNVSVPVDAMVTQVEMKLYASIEDLNKTIYEDHLQKLYYKVDGVAYKNEIKKLDERLETVEEELHDSGNSSIVSKLAEDVKSLEENLNLLNSSIGDSVVPSIQTLNNSVGEVLIPRIQTLEADTVRKDVAEELEEKMRSLLNDTEMFKVVLVDVLSNVQDVQNLEKEFQDFSAKLTTSLETTQRQIELLKNDILAKDGTVEPDDVDEIVQLSSFNVADNVTHIEDKFADFTTLETTTEQVTTLPSDVTTYVDRARIDREPEIDAVPCGVPEISDPHLLVDVIRNSEEKQSLKFGCKPLGRYAVPHLPVPPRCVNGTWKNPFPQCQKLLDVNEIDALSDELSKEYPCRGGSGEFPDPTNCTRFFKCAFGAVSVIPCVQGLHFNPVLKVCDYPRTAGCFSEKSRHVEELQTLIPPIHIEPDNLDKPGSHLATGKTGELIVHPRSSFTLHCLYPESMYGDAKWNVTYLQPDVVSRVLVPQKGSNRMSLTVTATKEEDSGTYRCVTPFGVVHDVVVIVKAVVCPAFPTDDNLIDVFYRPSPEGEIRILGTTAEVQCEEGHIVTAQCLADGTWSRKYPPKEECTPKGSKVNNMWNCEPLDASGHPHLILERHETDRIITFKCAGGMRLVGNTLTRCLDIGIWSQTNLPHCKK